MTDETKKFSIRSCRSSLRDELQFEGENNLPPSEQLMFDGVYEPIPYEAYGQLNIDYEKILKQINDFASGPTAPAPVQNPYAADPYKFSNPVGTVGKFPMATYNIPVVFTITPSNGEYIATPTFTVNSETGSAVTVSEEVVTPPKDEDEGMW